LYIVLGLSEVYTPKLNSRAGVDSAGDDDTGAVTPSGAAGLSQAQRIHALHAINQ